VSNRDARPLRRALPFLLGALCCVAVSAAEHKTQNIVFVMTDGLRRQEVFNGADAALMTKENGVSDAAALKREYWRDTAKARRETLMPFLWNVIAREGQIYGNRELGSTAYVTNGLNFSYPGYSEILCGFPDPRIDSNDKIPNRNVTVLEWLHDKPAYRGKVAAFGAWDTFPAILNAGRAGFLVNAGFDPLTVEPATLEIRLLNQLKKEAAIWGGEPLDAFTFHTAMAYVKEHKPRVLFLSLGETDEWAHEGKYANYLRAAQRVDHYLRELWETLQSMPEYRGATTMIFAVDHGRGDGPVEWRHHGEKVPAAKYVWMAFLGPDTRPLGERSNVADVTQSQVAATLAALLGEDYRGAVQKAGAPIEDVLPAATVAGAAGGSQQ
jgi:hypothetical protein